MNKITSSTFLYAKKKTGDAFEKVIDITSYPAPYEAPEKVDVSDLSSREKKYTAGMIDIPDLEFGFNYTNESYKAAKGFEGSSETEWQLRFGENGEYGVWTWKGDCFVTPSGGGVGDKREGTLTCYPETEVKETTVTV